LNFDTVPWTQVFLGQRDLGQTPLVDVELPAGRHALRLMNSERQIDRRYEVDIPADSTLTVPKVHL
jgi:serine/threonine-protein kinase